jgi:hypothetical protein
MFTIKMMRKNGYDVSQCVSYRVIQDGDATRVATWGDSGDIGSESCSVVESVCYVENDAGKTVDRIYGKVEYVPGPMEGTPIFMKGA